MFVTLTLPSYGRVHRDGTPRDLNSYDYRRAARDAIHFAKLMDRFWQNLRRCAGYKVQYFAAIEPQRRLTLHAHAAIRGVVTRDVLRQVVAATYEQVWWPPHDQPVYVDRLPMWDEATDSYVDPDTHAPLTSWEQAMDGTYEPDAEPAHLLWFGEQLDSQWFIPGSTRTDRRIGYICKYLTKIRPRRDEPPSAAASAAAARRDPVAALLSRVPELAAVRHRPEGCRVGDAARTLLEASTPARESRPRRSAGPRLSRLVRQNRRRAQGRPRRNRPSRSG
jgi:phage terminase large subunit-like protein